MGFLSAVSSVASSVGHVARRTAEICNLKTDRACKHAADMSDAELMQKNSATRRSASSCVVGIALNISLSVVCPPFVGAAVLNTWQLGVSLKNRHRIKEEVSRRRESKAGFERFYQDNNHRVKDILVGSLVKGAVVAIGAGIVGLEEIGEGFQALAQHAAPAAAQVGTESFVGVPHDEHLTSEDVASHHPRVAHADEAAHNVFFGFGDKVKDAAGVESSWHDLKDKVLGSGVWHAESVWWKNLGVGAAAELLNPTGTWLEEKWSKWFLGKDRAKAGATYVERKHDLSGTLSEKENEQQGLKEAMLRMELKEKFDRDRKEAL